MGSFTRIRWKLLIPLTILFIIAFEILPNVREIIFHG